MTTETSTKMLSDDLSSADLEALHSRIQQVYELVTNMLNRATGGQSGRAAVPAYFPLDGALRTLQASMTTARQAARAAYWAARKAPETARDN